MARSQEPGTSGRLHQLQRPKFDELLAYARPGDTVHISEMFRLVRGTGRIRPPPSAHRRAAVHRDVHGRSPTCAPRSATA
ncbi:hypothetical protein U9R90_01865 [Streptomyces sp. E11-3]|uniref:recombinase family protein n=1 Tax=Streptomyces sp. E11-3 TaxID=3110112 RepID=UPI00398058B6